MPYSADIYKVPTRSQELELHSDTAGDGDSQERELEAKWTEGASKVGQHPEVAEED